MGHSWHRVSNSPCVMKSLLLLPTPPIYILSNPSPPSPPTFTSTAIFDVLFLWLNGWSCHSWCVILLNDIVDLYMSSLDTLIPEELAMCFVQLGVKFTEVWHIMWLFPDNLIWYHTHIHTKTHSTLRGQ